MGRRKNIIIYLLVILLACCFMPEAGKYSCPGVVARFVDTHFLSATGKGQHTLVLKTPNIRKDWIKVRFMGGECEFDADKFYLNFRSAAFRDPVSSSNNYSFISSFGHVLFKLRGPPALS